MVLTERQRRDLYVPVAVMVVVVVGLSFVMTCCLTFAGM